MTYYIIRILRLLLLTFSMYGYAQHLRVKLSLKTDFILPVLFSFLGSTVFFAGILNVLVETVILIFIIGIVMSFLSVFRKDNPFALISGGTVACVLMIAVLTGLIYGNKFIGYDNFSHWGTVLRLIVNKDAFPNFEDKIIMFQSYPTGSASVIYYFSKVTGLTSEWFYIWMQAVITVFMTGSLFAFCKKGKPVQYISTAAVCAFILISNVDITKNILVDTLIPVVGVAGISICVYYRNEIAASLLFLLPITIFLVSIKNSGIFFAVIIVGYYIYCTVRSRGIKYLLSKESVILLVSPFITFLLWEKHVEYVFSNGMSAKHSMSSEYYEEIISQKTPEIISQISNAFIKKVFSPENTFFIILLALVAIIVFAGVKKIKSAVFYETLIVAVISYTVYQIGNYIMYLYSMPNEEALRLASYDRYHNTVLAFVAAILWISILHFSNSLLQQKMKNAPNSFLKNSFANAVSAVIAVAILGFSVAPQFTFLKKQVYEGTDREKLENIVENNEIYAAPDKSCLMIWEKDSDGYRYFLSQYILNTSNVQLLESESENEIINKIKSCEYVIVLDHTDLIDECLLKVYGSNTEEVYKKSDIINNEIL